jgi:hypothetical protein
MTIAGLDRNAASVPQIARSTTCGSATYESSGCETTCENDGLRWPRRDGLKWPHLASVVVGVDLA